MAPRAPKGGPPTRRSPRTVVGFINGLDIPGLTNEVTGIHIALAHCTGWSADRISCTLQQVTGTTKNPEEIWDYYRKWEFGREGEEIDTVKEDELMKVLMGSVGVQMQKFRRPLSATLRPNAQGTPILPGFTLRSRQANKQMWYNSKSSSILSRFAHDEEVLISQFGDVIVSILKAILERWGTAMCKSLEGDTEFRPIEEKKQVDLIMLHLRYYQLEYEKRYGRMEHAKTPTKALFTPYACYINSTGYGIKVVLGLMMADRLHVMDWKLKAKRKKISFLKLDNLSLEGHDCPICCETWSQASPDGAQENPLKLIICCRQIMGEKCLKMWLWERDVNRRYKDTCPICRYKFPTQFISKLFASAPANGHGRNNVPVVDLVTPSPNPRGEFTTGIEYLMQFYSNEQPQTFRYRPARRDVGMGRPPSGNTVVNAAPMDNVATVNDSRERAVEWRDTVLDDIMAGLDGER